jgi:hypothetical protein
MNVAGAISALVLVDEDLLRGTYTDNPLEYSLTMVASLAYATCKERFHMSYLAIAGDKRDTLSGTGQGFYKELAIRLAKFTGYGPVDWDQQGKYILGYLPAGSSLLVFTANLDAAAKERLRNLAAHFRGLVVITFNKQSFAAAKRPRHKTPVLSFGEGYILLEVYYGDDLGSVIEKALAKHAALRRSAAKHGAMLRGGGKS